MATLVISYSREDQALIRAVVALLRGAMRDIENAVFWDEDFEAGESWFEQLREFIDATPQLFVFWCNHSSDSVQVRREFTYALAKNKRVVPVLLDSTPLAPELSEIHGIDLRGAIIHRPLNPRRVRSIDPGQLWQDLPDREEVRALPNDSSSDQEISLNKASMRHESVGLWIFIWLSLGGLLYAASAYFVRSWTRPFYPFLLVLFIIAAAFIVKQFIRVLPSIAPELAPIPTIPHGDDFDNVLIYRPIVLETTTIIEQFTIHLRQQLI